MDKKEIYEHILKAEKGIQLVEFYSYPTAGAGEIIAETYRLGLVKKEDKMETILDAVKMVAVNFAEWLSKNEWKKKAKTRPKHIGKYWSDIHCEYKTINDLYEMFLVDERGRLKT